MNPLFHELEKYNGWRKYWTHCSFSVWANDKQGYIEGEIYYDKVGLWGRSTKTYAKITVWQVVVDQNGWEKKLAICHKLLDKYIEQIRAYLEIPQFLKEVQAAIESPLESVKDAALVKVHKYLSEKK